METNLSNSNLLDVDNNNIVLDKGLLYPSFTSIPDHVKLGRILIISSLILKLVISKFFFYFQKKSLKLKRICFFINMGVRVNLRAP